MKLATIAALGLLALAAVSSAVKCGVGSSLSSCTITEVADNNYQCYSCAITTGGTFAGLCDNSVTTGITACATSTTTVTGMYSGCTW